MQLTLALFALCFTSIHAFPATEDTYSQVSNDSNLCGEQISPCYQETQSPAYDYQPEQDEGDIYMDENEGEDEGEGEDSMDDTSTQPESSYNMPNFNMADLQPRKALLDRVNAHSSSDADALSNSNQFDQAQIVDQTLYQPKQQQPQIIITQPAARSYDGGRKKYKRSAHKYFKIRYTSGNRYIE
ncbi:hypothetical protein K493DRAFT_349209 [Basidiobolus meristosporus CBS 931.73]|uniref:Uncharacterized protein n=1 Tax=Basidiobolus meristosporus CBS 931.73 TaxID=1314790 RepID=A0A1Y1YKH2_9FUNG|nr:hypothetical protein K493DRAFT_349209 [Basidiobolus meristosporus CBS 931.73]|eukprot:ORX98511.1 hypothetical protein K493DRAFT_349209 [Basidiobolus meristosporus CBS 931.73]